MEKTMIPKIIHYCWFGSKELPAEYQRYLHSWQEKCPDYQIIRWDESNYDIQQNRYMAQAAAKKKWGFVSDYLSFDVVYRYGGIYLDTDVELLRNFDDVLSCQAFMGFEENEKGYSVAPGLGFGAQKNNPTILKLRQMYDGIDFITPEGKLNTLTIPVYTTDFLLKHGLQPNNQMQTTAGVKIFPTDYFAPMDFLTGEIKTTSNSHSIHHYGATWQNATNLRHIQIIRQVNRKFGKKWGMRFNWVLRANWALARRMRALFKH
ncbi:glycosyltransferase family 32 protein [Liquorilactobacillus ghanensis]|uniref:Glycosyltransferase n=2 Tax=Liquorilactobacillus ghanensis TaxID=399370 RepID=A0A0R1VS93_9LACO|nr:glycosyltransferase [Liquorilactobacillus ghanensis DSM 18630]